MPIHKKPSRDANAATMTIQIYWNADSKWWDIVGRTSRGRVYKERAQTTADMDDMSLVLITKSIRAELEGWVF